MELRSLQQKDAQRMLQWMHDKSVTKDLKANFAALQLEDCEKFIQEAGEDQHMALHLAIVDDQDVYMGTVSLKDINLVHGYAEFAIVLHPDAMGKGYGDYAMKEILRVGFTKYALAHIIWCVDDVNIRAVKFYNKHGYQEIMNPPVEYAERYHDISKIHWYGVNS